MEILVSVIIAGWTAASFGTAKLLSDRYSIQPWLPLGFVCFISGLLVALLAANAYETSSRERSASEQRVKDAVSAAAQREKLNRFNEERECLSKEKSGIPFDTRCQELFGRASKPQYP